MEQKDLHNLPFWPEIEKKLRSGEQVLPISRNLQEQGYFTDMKLSALNMALTRAKNKLIGKPSEWTIAKVNYLLREALKKNPKLNKYIKKISTKVDALIELETLYQLQVNRICKWLELEETMKGDAGVSMPLTQTRDEVKEARSTLVAIYEIQAQLGLVDRKPEELLLRFDDKLKQMPPEKREKLRQVIRLIKSERGVYERPKAQQLLNEGRES